MADATMSVADIQRALIARGYDLGPSGADSDAGPMTIAALEAFQAVAGLLVDGDAGPMTIKALKTTDISKRRTAMPQPAWLTLAAAEIGTVEGIGNHNNPKVVAYYRDAGFPGVKSDSTAWCAAYVGAMLHRAGIKPSGSLAARSYERWGVGLKTPVLGCVATKKRGNSSWQGHVGFLVGMSKTEVFLLGGNQDDRCSVATFKRSEITAYRWPSGVPIPTQPNLPTTIAGAKSGVKES
jgi:uncharacterized protein (TIGR02594 family)